MSLRLLICNKRYYHDLTEPVAKPVDNRPSSAWESLVACTLSKLFYSISILQKDILNTLKYIKDQMKLINKQKFLANYCCIDSVMVYTFDVSFKLCSWGELLLLTEDKVLDRVLSIYLWSIEGRRPDGILSCQMKKQKTKFHHIHWITSI